MSVESISRALNLDDDRLNPTQRLLLVGIANHDGDGGAWPTLETLARYCGVSVRSVQRQLRTVEQLGYVTVQAQAGGTPKTPDGYRPNRYVLHFDRGDASVTPGVTPTSGGGVTPTSPEPSLEPSVQPSLSSLAPTSELVVQPFTVPQVEEDWFERFWTAYPRKVGKPAARRAFTAAWKKAPLQTIGNGLRRWVRYWEEQGDPQFIPHPATWLNQERWNDQPPAPARKQAPGMTALRNIVHRAQTDPRWEVWDG